MNLIEKKSGDLMAEINIYGLLYIYIIGMKGKLYNWN